MASMTLPKNKDMVCQELVNWYLNYCATNSSNSVFLSAFNSTNVDKAYVLGVGDSSMKRDNHMYYLWRFRRNWNSRDELLRRIRANSLWSSLPATISDFEGIYDNVRSTLNNPKIPQIAQLAIYDISVRLAYLQSNKNLLPKKVVYIHALPMAAFNLLIKKNIVKNVKRNTYQVPYCKLASYFSGLDAFQIEDLLCQLGKSRRLVSSGYSAKKAGEQAMDQRFKKDK